MSKKEIGVTMSVANKDIPINGNISSNYDKDGNLVIKFKIGTSRLEEVKLVFNKKLYLDKIDE